MTDARIPLPWKVRFENAHAGVTRYRDGTERRMTARYFATKEEAVAFCGNERRVLYRPGEAWRRASPTEVVRKMLSDSVASLAEGGR